MEVPSFDDFLATLTDEDMKTIISQANEKSKEIAKAETNFDTMSAISENSANFCIVAMFTLLRRYHEWLMSVL